MSMDKADTFVNVGDVAYKCLGKRPSPLSECTRYTYCFKVNGGELLYQQYHISNELLGDVRFNFEEKIIKNMREANLRRQTRHQ